MVTPANVPVTGSSEALKILLICSFVSLFAIGDYFKVWPTSVVSGMLLVLPMLLVILIYLAVKLARMGHDNVPFLPTILLILFIAGGAAFDIFATLYHSPDLKREQNPIARHLLDSGKSLGLVLAYGAVGQFLYVSFISCMAVGLLKHKGQIVQSTPPQPFWKFVKNLTGGAHLTFRQWLLPTKLSHLPSAYLFLWVCMALLIAGSADRWLLGFIWFGFLPHEARLPAVCLWVAIGLAGYGAWIWKSAANRVPLNE